MNPRSLIDAFLTLWFLRASGIWCMNQKPAGSTLGHPKTLLAGTVWAFYAFIGLVSLILPTWGNLKRLSKCLTFIFKNVKPVRKVEKEKGPSDLVIKHSLVFLQLSLIV